MPNRRTRNRQLARLAQRRYAERRRRQQQRARVIAAALVIGLGGATVAVLAFRNDEPQAAASGSATPTSSASPTTAADEVACGGSVPRAAKDEKPTFDEAPKMSIDTSTTYVATIRTSCGTIEARLLAAQAPQTVNSFVFLASRHFFDGTQIHRIDTTIDVIQGGDPTGTGTGGPGYTIPDELAGTESYGPGVVAMANAGPDTGGSQFFIVFGPNGHDLDANPNYTIFGRVVIGLDVAKEIGALPIIDPQAAAGGDLSGQRPKQAVYLEKVTISTKG
jgi:cyclophilin family peptidyl-prolyl cis-trans isomerase